MKVVFIVIESGARHWNIFSVCDTKENAQRIIETLVKEVNIDRKTLHIEEMKINEICVD